MGNIIAGALGALAIVALVIVSVCLGTFFGGVAGWIVGFFFTETIMTTLYNFGVETYGMTMWQLGATLGFISGFFKSSTVRTNS